MRITNNYIYTTSEENLSEGYERVAKLQSEVSTGIRISNAGEDPLGMSQITLLQSHLDAVSQGESNAGVAKNELDEEQTNLGNLSKLIQQVIQQSEQMANGTHNSKDIKQSAVKFSGYLDQLISIANAKNTNGDSIFSGTALSSDAYSIAKDADGNVTGATYQGNDDQQKIGLSSGIDVKIYQSGNNVFGSGSDSIFSNLISFITQLKSGSLSGDQAQDEIKKLKAFQDTNETNLTSTQNQYGFANFEVSTFNQLKSNYAKELGKVKDADYSKVVTKLSQQTTLLKATMSASLELEKLTIFDQN